MCIDLSEGPSPLKETLKPEVADVTKTPVNPSGLLCNLGSLLAYFSLVIVYQVISKREKRAYLLSG
jgi:hypothetical protein